jgi:hypothetical protein
METIKIHRFEAAGLGKAPFTCVGTHQECVNDGDSIRATGTCDFCGTGIRYCFDIQSSDGKTFKVGCDCVEKTDDSGLKRQVSNIQREAKKTPAQREREAAQHAEWLAYQAEQKKVAEAEAIKQAANIAKYQWLIDELSPLCTCGLRQNSDGRFSGNGFVSEMTANLLNGQNPNDWTYRMKEITCEIYAKTAGRRNSKAYNDKADEFWAKLEQ